MDNNEQLLFHTIQEEESKEKGPIAAHLEKHYKKHLFGLGILFGIALLKIITVLGSYLGVGNIATATNAAYSQPLIETALQTFDHIESLASQRDKFFHQEGKIYRYSGEIVFNKLDAIYHILDNAYRSASGSMEEKFKMAEKLNNIISQQNTLFQAVQDINLDRETSLQELNTAFNDLQKQIQKK